VCFSVSLGAHRGSLANSFPHFAKSDKNLPEIAAQEFRRLPTIDLLASHSGGDLTRRIAQTSAV
jgi:hypothetical protein